MPSLLVVCFFPAFNPASSGGELRLGNLYRAVSRFHDVTLVTSTDFDARFEEIQHTPSFREYRFPKDRLWRNAYAALAESGVTGELSGLAFALAVSDPACGLRVFARERAARSDYVIHEFPYSEPLFSDGCPCPEIYNSHNFEASLLSSTIEGAELHTALGKLLRLEGNLVARAQRIFATSGADAEKFRVFYGAAPERLGICPNGFEPAAVPAAGRDALLSESDRPRLLFLGSRHQPNVDAARFLLELAPQLPDCDLILAGGVCEALPPGGPANVIRIGAFSDSDKSRLLGSADLFLNPIELGSGTSLKAIEALASGLPVLSTREGMRGLAVATGVHCEIAERREFATVATRLLRDRPALQRLGLAGRTWVTERCIWSSIASQFVDDLAAPPPASATRRPLILAFNDYPVAQAGSGGATRIRELLSHLDGDTILLTFGRHFDVIAVADGVLQVSVPKTLAHRDFEAAVNAGQTITANDVVASLFAASNPVLRSVTQALALRAQVFVFEHPYLAPLLDVVDSDRRVPVIYSAHNVESSHKAELLRTHRLGARLVAFVSRLESRLVAAADLIVCCTEADADRFDLPAAKLLVVPNGCSLPAQSLSSPPTGVGAEPTRITVGFLGSGHGPNVDAARFICEVLAPAFPDALFEIVGQVGTALAAPLPVNVVLRGLVSETEKSTRLAAWDVALNPVVSGGGSSLKLPDYLAHGLATLSTPVGARGFEVAEEDAGRVAKLADFPAALADLIADEPTRAALRGKARGFAERLQWTQVTAPYRARVEALRRRALPAPTAPRLLVVTYRYTEPPLGGAEEYLIEVLKRLRPRFSRLDLAAIDTGSITDHHHFGCRLGPAPGGASRRVGDLFDRMQFFEADPVAEATLLQTTRALEQSWCAEELTLLTPFAGRLAAPGRPRVFAGLFAPERLDGEFCRWTSPDFSFLVPAATRLFELAGYTAKPKTLRLTVLQCRPDGEPVEYASNEAVLAPEFRVCRSVPAPPTDQPLILRFHVEEHAVASDHRPLGLVLTHARALLERTGSDGVIHRDDGLDVLPVDLTEVLEDELREHHVEEWISALQAGAQRRSPATDRGFAAVRGPHSEAMQAWIAAQASSYDVILVQGVPFDVIPRTMQTLAALAERPRVVLLPHFHGDDRFYHWRRFTEAFAAADSTLLFSDVLARRFVGTARIAVVPGGGVRSDEPASLDAERAFRAVHSGSKPFWLVLGRKIGSKGYERIIEAHRELRRHGSEVSLVLIGPDEDQRPVKGEAVHCLGHQPRAVVRGALGACTGLISMSRSESFGIALCEAWLFGKPVIANRACHAFRELVRHEENGLLVSTQAELLAAMTRLTQEPETAVRLGRAGFDEVMRSFTWETIAEAIARELIVPPADSVLAVRSA